MEFGPSTPLLYFTLGYQKAFSIERSITKARMHLDHLEKAAYVENSRSVPPLTKEKLEQIVEGQIVRRFIKFLENDTPMPNVVSSAVVKMLMRDAAFASKAHFVVCLSDDDGAMAPTLKCFASDVPPE